MLPLEPQNIIIRAWIHGWGIFENRTTNSLPKILRIVDTIQYIMLDTLDRLNPKIRLSENQTK